MSRFDYFVVFYSLLLGLSVAELLSGYANLLRERNRPTLGILTPLLSVVIFVQIMAVFIDAWTKLRDVQINLVGLAAPTLIGIAFFAAAAMAVPRQTSEWNSLDEYFFERRYWLIGLLFAVAVLVMTYEAPRLWIAYQRGLWANLAEYFISNLALLTLYVLLMRLRKPRWCVAALIAILLFFFYYYTVSQWKALAWLLPNR
jgi:hypothetical protein